MAALAFVAVVAAVIAGIVTAVGVEHVVGGVTLLAFPWLVFTVFHPQILDHLQQGPYGYCESDLPQTPLGQDLPTDDLAGDNYDSMCRDSSAETDASDVAISPASPIAAGLGAAVGHFVVYKLKEGTKTKSGS